MSVMSERHRRYNEIAESFIDDLLHNGMTGDEVERVMTSPVLLEDEFDCWLDSQVWTGEIHGDLAQQLFKDPNLVLDFVG